MFKKVIFIANTGFALYNFRLPLMRLMIEQGWEVVGVANDEADFAEKFKEAGIKFIHVNMDHKGKNPLADLALIRRLKTIYQQERPNLVHHFTIKPVIFGSIGAKLADVSSIVNTITGLGYVFEKEGILNKIVLRLYKHALCGRPQVIFQNSDDQELFLTKGLVKKAQSHVILGSGVNCLKLIPIEKNKKTSIIFLLFARMLWPKGIREFVTAAEKIKAEFPETIFIMAGGASGGGAVGNPQMIPEAWLQDVNSRDKVQWVGRVPFDRIISLLDESDVVVLPSYYPEGVPKSLIEAAAKGEAIITTDTPGCREVVVDGLNGYLVPPRDTIALTEAMHRLVKNPALVQQMGIESRKRAETIFDEKIVLSQTLQVYQQAAAL